MKGLNNLSIGLKIMLLNGVILVLMAGALLHIYNELGKANDIILAQSDSMKKLEAVSKKRRTNFQEIVINPSENFTTNKPSKAIILAH